MKIILLISTIACLLIICNAVPISSRKKDVDTNKKTNQDTKSQESSITEEEKKFVREIEEKFNIKRDSFEYENINKESVQKPLPAVIAIEIVNDNSTDNKEKRTIDANLGYGYKTDHGYFYSHFGRKPEEKGKFMIYPYSQHDLIPKPNLNKNYKYHTQVDFNNNKPKQGQRTLVEIQPSKAYQLVPISPNEVHDNTYKLDGAVSQFRSKYEHIQSVQTPPPQYAHHPQPQPEIPTTLYSTLNGGHLSSLSGNFPMVMPNYFISPSQFLNQYQEVNAHAVPPIHQDIPLKTIVPVLILRIPSSQIQNPTAEFYPKLPHTNPYASTLNHINIQSLVNQYLQRVQPQYEVPVAPEPKYIIQYKRPMYYEPNPHYFMLPQQPQYQQQYEEPNQQYEQQQPEPEQEQRQIQYVIPQHSTPMPQSYSYEQKVNSYSENEELPFSENYPDNDHTRVVYTPQYQHQLQQEQHQHQEEQQQQQQQEEHHNNEPQQLHPVTVMPYKHIYHTNIKYVNPQSVQIQTPLQNYQEKESEDEMNEEDDVSSSSVAPPVHYNYHAHPYPKRELKDKRNTNVSSNANKNVNTNAHVRKLRM